MYTKAGIDLLLSHHIPTFTDGGSSILTAVTESLTMGGQTIRISSVQVSLIPLAKGLVEFLEEITGKGSVYACILEKPKHIKSKSKMQWIVQFESPELAMKVYDLSRAGTLMFRSVKLMVEFVDIESLPKSTPACLEGVDLHMGCQISENGFYVLWSSTKVVAVFGSEIRRISMFLKERYIEYKMELLFSDIRHIHLRYVKGKGTKLLLLQGGGRGVNGRGVREYIVGR
eukprot:Gb_28438 [translate_table: standard]